MCCCTNCWYKAVLSLPEIAVAEVALVDVAATATAGVAGVLSATERQCSLHGNSVLAEVSRFIEFVKDLLFWLKLGFRVLQLGGTAGSFLGDPLVKLSSVFVWSLLIVVLSLLFALDFSTPTIFFIMFWGWVMLAACFAALNTEH